MRATLISLVGALIAVVIGVAILPTVFSEIDTLDNIVGESGKCSVVSNRYHIDIAEAATNWNITLLPSDSPYMGSDAPLGYEWTINEQIAHPSYTGLPQGDIKCGRELENGYIYPTVFVGSQTSPTAVPIIQTVIAEVSNKQNPFNPPIPPPVGSPVTPVPATATSLYVGIDFEPGSEREYGKVMGALVGLMPLLIIVGVVAFIVFVFGMGTLSRVGGFGRKGRGR